MGPASAIAAVLLAAGVTTAGGRSLQGVKKSRGRGVAKRREAKRKLKGTAG